MRNKLLITTALVALLGVSNAYALEISEDLSKDSEYMALETNNINILDGANVTFNDTDLLSLKEINIEGGNVNFSDESDIAAIEGVNINGGTVSVDDGEIWSLGDINFNGGDVSIDNFGIVNTSIDYMDDDFGEQEAPETPGNINITGGTVTTGNVVFLTKGNINISDNGILNVEAGKTTYTSKELTPDDDNVTDKSTINLTNGGTINLSGKLASNIDGDDRGTINFQNSSSVVDGNVNTPSLTFNASHSLSNAVTGTIGSLDKLTVAKGTLNFDKETTGTITSVQVNNGATLDIGDKTLHSTGHKASGEGVTFADNSTLKFAVTSKDKHGQIKANYVNISDKGTTLNMALNGAALSEGDGPLTIKLFDQSQDKEGVEIDGQFANLPTNARYDFVANVDENGNFDGSYTVTAKENSGATDIVEDATGSSNNSATAEAWDNLDTGSVTNASTIAVAEKLAELSNNATTPEGKKAYVDALTALAPEVAPVIQQTATETTNQVFGAVGTRLSGGAVSTGGKGATVGNQNRKMNNNHRGGQRHYRGHRGKASGDNNFETGALWVQGMYNKAELEDTSKSAGFDSETSGVAFGAEKSITNNTKVGIGYAYSQTEIDGLNRTTDVDTHTAILYGEYKPSQWYVNGIATYGWSDYAEKKNVAGVNINADYDAETFGLQAMTGYEMQINGFGFTPETGLRYVHIKQDAYKDTADQKVSASTSDILTAVLGAKLNKTVEFSNGAYLTPEVRFAATYDIMNDDTSSVVTLANGSAYTVNGEALDELGFEVGAGLTAGLNEQIELSIGYEGKFKKDYQDHTGLLNAKYKF